MNDIEIKRAAAMHTRVYPELRSEAGKQWEQSHRSSLGLPTETEPGTPSAGPVG